ncbi:zinc finger protein 391-like [Cydia pomonella]|uniref:zinc finger protein 391-like n=1 Tax=Cydia pomonella TaxID=82600 RepID=UPI002ADE3437|nr:zinc finger protein 391-like [Cydia pomonella]
MEIRLEDFNRCCRCCLAMVDAMKPIFGACLNDMLTTLMSFQIAQNDGYPQQMCSQCVRRLSSSYTFYTMVMRSHKTLEEILKTAEKNGELSASTECQEQRKEKVYTEIEKIEKTTPLKSYVQKKVACDLNFNTKTMAAKPNTPIISDSENSESPSDKEDYYHCSQCEHTSKNQETFEIHLRTHLVGPKNISKDLDVCLQLCNICGARFRWRTSLHKHLRRHRGGRHRCEVCQKVFAEASTLNVHMVSHSLNQKPYQCNTCGRSFTQQSTLRKHAQTHDARSQLKCSDCEKSFLHRYSLLRHHENAHSANECPLCREIFRGKKLLDAHMKLHKKETDSPHTEMLTDNEMVTESINIQTVTVEFLCLICTQKFQSRESLEVHICAKDKIS